nr:DUF1800 family protein [Aquidulcibacter sp.]
MVIIGCGSGGGAPKLDAGLGSSSSLPQPAPPPPPPPPVQAPQPPFPDKPASRADAARFLNQATFGATSAEIDRLMSIGYNAWLDEQFAMPRKQSFINWYSVDGPTSNAVEFADGNTDRESAAWFTLSTQEPDQLRLRMAWALSQIFVVSRNKVGANAIHWMDLTADNSFGTYREFLERATFSPIMAQYLDYMNNTDRNGNAPDQNYAREVMQLFSIGLWQLNLDGSLKLDSSGARIPTYSQADVTGLSYVFTGLRMQYGGDRYGTCRDRAGNLLPPTNEEAKLVRCELSVWDFASTREHNFLGVKIPAIPTNSTPSTIQANGRKNIGIALDTLANHPNTAPFISKQLIQRFTTSNPSPAYVSRVVAKFENNGQGVRGDFKAVLKQILLDPEARVQSNNTPYEFGKVREPILAIAQLNRVLKAGDGKGNVWAGAPGCKIYFDIISEMERPYNSATVFNFYRPSFTPANGRLAAMNLTAPEMQITDTNAALDWSRFVLHALQRGGTGCGHAAKVQNTFAYDEFWNEGTDAEKLADKVLTLLAPGVVVSDLRPALVRSINSLPAVTDTDRTNRIKLAVMMTMLTPEYRVQR